MLTFADSLIRSRFWITAIGLGVVSALANGASASEDLQKVECTAAVFNYVLASGQWRYSRFEEPLFSGSVESARPLGGANKNAVWLVDYVNRGSGKRVRAVTKPRAYGDGDGWNNVTREYTAYFISRGVLGMDYVPPAAYRKNFNLSGNGHSIYVHEGSTALFVPDSQRLVDVPRDKWGISEAALLSDHRILRVLMGDPDGHEDNVRFGSHWDGSGRSAPFFIDFGAAWIPSRTVLSSPFVKELPSMTSYPAHTGFFKTPVNHIRRSTLERLRLLQALRDAGQGDLPFRDLIPTFIGRREIEKFYAALAAILRYFEGLEQARPGQVILEE